MVFHGEVWSVEQGRGLLLELEIIWEQQQHPCSQGLKHGGGAMTSSVHYGGGSPTPLVGKPGRQDAGEQSSPDPPPLSLMSPSQATLCCNPMQVVVEGATPAIKEPITH